MSVKFILDPPFKVEDMKYNDYQHLIKGLRDQLGVRLVHDLPVLADQCDPPKFFDLILRTNDHSVKFRFRSDNLYLLGYVPVDKKDTHWLEFDNEQRKHLIKESEVKFLGFKGTLH
ncbi:hypothetical protein QN277_011663 [Acacia crassicarpa]|uniref:rRNA N-glycosylase n=1 Tax=Acacia crassicarpa TaxID=499986 RepID=A0AAE1MYV6_9FABA|nr:hypothetical protein QN277_011663 [Acacia crassicarpa]